MRYLRLLAGATTLLCVSLVHAGGHPNIVYILADDLGAKDVSFRGGNIQTPHLDKLAQAGTVLTQFYVQPFSTQTRAAMLTGRYPMRYGLQTLSLLPSSQSGLPPEERTLAQTLQTVGYKTAFIGKWQLGFAKPEFTPAKRGFDYFYGTLSGDVPYFLKKTAKSDWQRGSQPLREDGYVTSLLARDAAAFIDKQDAAAPFFLVVSFNAPQGVASAPKEFLDRFANVQNEARRQYSAAVAALDDAIGAILAALERKKLSEQTLIVFHSDNGGAVPTRFTTGDGDVKAVAADNDIFRDGKGSLYEGGVRTFALLHWPKVVPTGMTSDITHVTDMYATLARVADAKIDQPKAIDGVDMWPTITENALSPRKEVLLNVEDFRGAIRVGEWKLIVHSALPARIELFNLAMDPEEAENRANTNGERVQELLKRLDAYAYDMAPAKYLEEMARAHGTDIPIYWGYNPSRK